MLIRHARRAPGLGNLTCPSLPGSPSVSLSVSKCPTPGWVKNYQLIGKGPGGATAQASMLKSYAYWVSPAGTAQKAAIVTVQKSGLQPTAASFVPGAGAAAVKGVTVASTAPKPAPVVVVKPAPVAVATSPSGCAAPR